MCVHKCKQLAYLPISFFSMPISQTVRVTNIEPTPAKINLFTKKKTAFLSGISLHFRLFVVRYGFSLPCHMGHRI